MRRRNFIAGLSAALAVSCAREERRAARYDVHQCPFCIPEKGVCSYCGGSKKCSFCNGTGTRKTAILNDLPEEKAIPQKYEEKCPYCGGTGNCRYCDGSGKCHGCNGTGHTDNWDALKGPKKNAG